MDKWVQYTEFLLACFAIFAWTSLLLIFFISWIGNKIVKKRFFIAAERSLELKSIEEMVKGITNDFEVYRNNRFGFKSQSVIELCQELEQKLKLYGSLSDIQRLENVIAIYKDEYKFDDDKMNDVIENIKKKSGPEDARTVREYLIRIIAFHNGVVYEKERHIKDIQEKLTRRKWFNRFCGLIGFVGSVASIYGLFQK